MNHQPILLGRIRWLNGFFIVGLILSGATAITDLGNRIGTRNKC